MDCTNCENVTNCERVQASIKTASNTWYDLLMALKGSLDALAQAHCDYARDAKSIDFLRLVTASVVDAFNALKAAENPLLTPPEPEPEPEPEPVS
jgi:hypothetical protein